MGVAISVDKTCQIYQMMIIFSKAENSMKEIITRLRSAEKDEMLPINVVFSSCKDIYVVFSSTEL